MLEHVERPRAADDWNLSRTIATVSATTATVIFGLSCWAITVISTGVLAHRRGRLVRSWAASAFFFGFFALLLLSTLPPLQREATNT
jgi:hypothetical protein